MVTTARSFQQRTTSLCELISYLSLSMFSLANTACRYVTGVNQA